MARSTISGKKKGGTAKYGRNHDKCQRYRLERRRLKHKLRRIRKNNGPEAAKKYEQEYKDRR